MLELVNLKGKLWRDVIARLNARYGPTTTRYTEIPLDRRQWLAAELARLPDAPAKE